MNKRPKRLGLGAQLFLDVLISLLAAAIVFVPAFWIWNSILDETVYGETVNEHATDRYFKKLQEFVSENNVATGSLRPLDDWCRKSKEVFLIIYDADGELLYVYPASTGVAGEDGSYSEYYEDPDNEYPLVLEDGEVVSAFIYYYPSSSYYYWVLVTSILIAFIVFSICFIVLIHRKLKYIVKLKAELDILAGGNLRYQITVSGGDELGELARGIDEMRKSIVSHREAEERIRAANSELVTAMSHDLRTPLTSLLAYLELLERGKYENEDQMRYFINRSLEKTMQIKTLADKLFEYFLVYSPDWEESLEPVDADEMLNQILGECAFSLENKGYEVRCDFQELGGRLRVDTELLKRVFDNLYSNVLKYADADKPVCLSFMPHGGEVVIAFENAVSAGRAAEESTNIGLKTCERILTRCGGSFRVEESNGQFTAVLKLPLEK